MIRMQLDEFQRTELKDNNRRPVEAGRFLERTVPFSTEPVVHKRGTVLLTDYLMHTFSVDRDEVAFLVLDRKGTNLMFVAPEYLADLKSTFPFDRDRSIAGKALWDQRSYIENRVFSVNHLSYFERAKCGNLSVTRIEKILTYPVTVNRSPVGVVQISRKKKPLKGSRPDFQKSDLSRLDAVRIPLLRLMQGIRSGR